MLMKILIYLFTIKFCFLPNILFFLILSCSNDTPLTAIINPTGQVSDIDGNVYHTVKLGNQEWTVENLRVTKYNDGTSILNATDSIEWANRTTPAYCFYHNTTHPETIEKWGALYNWHVVSPANPKKIAPPGWHVPTDSDWVVLEKYLTSSGYNFDGTTTLNRIAKSMAAKTDWLSSEETGAPGNDMASNNRTGFSAFPVGIRESNGRFIGQNYEGDWWSTTEVKEGPTLAYAHNIFFTNASFLKRLELKSFGFSVRLVRDGY